MNPPAPAPSRQAMHDLVVPPDISFLPATPAWFVLLALLAMLGAWGIWRGVRHWRRNAYRREALAALAGAGPAEIAAILKRAALAAWPRAEVAALSGAAWASFLRRTAPRAQLDEATSLGLADLAYGTPLPGAREAAARWIRRHDSRR